MKRTAPFVRASTYMYDTNQAGDESGLSCPEPTLTQQHMADECDINILVDRFVVSGEMPQLVMPPLQQDFDQVPDFQSAMNLIVEANKSFMQMDAKVRSRFNNDPGQFVSFCSDDTNRDEMRRMGLWSTQANAAFELKAQTQRDLDAANAADAAAYRESKTPKGDTKKGVT